MYAEGRIVGKSEQCSTPLRTEKRQSSAATA
jgi:hypothetical protein